MERKEQFLTAMLQQLSPPRGGKNKRIKLSCWAKEWLEGVRLRVKESSYVKYCNLLQNHILPELGEWTADQLTTGAIERFVQQKLEHGRKDGTGGLSEKTVKDILNTLKEVCLYAANWDLEIPCHFEQIKIRRRDGEVRILTRQKQLELAQFLVRDNSLTKLGILLSLYMGLRLGEVCALQRGCISYHEGVLSVRSTMQRIQNLKEEEPKRKKKTRIIITEPKSSSSVRDIPIPPFLLKRLEPLKDLPENAYVLTGSESRFIEPRTLENILKRYLQECELEGVNYHVLRHTFATRCIEDGFDVKSLSEILGHASVNITLNRYVHSSLEQKRKHMEKVGEEIRRS